MSSAETRRDAPASRFLAPEVLARIGNIELLARTVVEGFVSGLHKSPYLGRSVDFAEHRAYMPGDDIRRIDWRLFGRTDRFYLKEFEADSNTDLVQLLDVSRSMRFTSHALTKLDYARYLVACLAYLARKQRDRVGLVTFDEDVIDFVPPSAKHLPILLHTLDRVDRAPEGGGKGALARPLHKAGEACHRRGLMVLVSDLYEDPRAVLDAVALLSHRGSDLMVFHVLDPAELELPEGEPAAYEDLESGERIPVVPDAVRERYRALMAEHIATLSRVLGENRIDYGLFDTSKPLDHALASFLTRRERMVRVR
ncbi:MAG TPA: DUF58 domain-containing protein [Vicinamibacteria bacterium]|jgi:uncharacterized protein (DUF58 family)|nr:DUF58 domain-containing protein [Vicinamibacteria bacterium]